MTTIQTPHVAKANFAVRYSHLRTRDAGEHAASLGQWDQSYEQLSCGGFVGELQEIALGPVQVFREYANQALLQSGQPRPGTVTLGIVDTVARAYWYCGRRQEDGSALTATDEAFELIAGAQTRLTALCIDLAYLRALHTQLRGPEFEWRDQGPRLLGRTAFNRPAFAAMTNAAMALAQQQPDVLREPAAANMLTLSLSELVLDALAPAHADLPPLPGSSARHQIVATARDYMRAHASDPITVPELCTATGASRRALQYAFEDVVQLSPVTYLRVMRLNRVRAELQRRPQDTVGDVAARWGFWHLSRFAADYRELFGELPSATRAHFAESG